MIWINIVAILFLAKPALATLKDYERQQKLGIKMRITGNRNTIIRNMTIS